jgi:ribosomal protein S18 acetylase RimI-like enzyme
MRIRPADTTDAEDIHRVSLASCRAAYEGVLDDEAFLDMADDPSRIDALRQHLADTASDESVVYLVAETDGSVVGFLLCLYGIDRPRHVDENDAYVKSLYVHPDVWNEGIGSELLEEGLARLPPELDRVQVGVLAANEIGKRFYEARGFERMDDGTFEVGGGTYEAHFYYKRL